MLRLFRLFMAEDTGAEGGTPPAQKPTEGDKSDDDKGGVKNIVNNLLGKNPPNAEDPKWFSQLDKTRRDDKRYDGLKGCKTINDLADSFVNMKERSVIFPDGKSTTEEMEGFLKKMDIPYGKDAKYELSSDEKFKDNKMVDAVRENFLNDCAKYALSRKQAQGMWDNMQATIIASAEVQTNDFKNRQQTFGARMNTAYQKEYTIDADRQKAIEADQNVVKAFLHDTGLVDVFKNSGILLDPSVVRAIAQHERKTGGASGVLGSQGGKGENANDPDGGIKYGKQFNDLTAGGEKNA